jgi:UDP-2,3-diacylglucosamine pyrophosphatase LpxH
MNQNALERLALGWTPAATVSNMTNQEKLASMLLSLSIPPGNVTAVLNTGINNKQGMYYALARLSGVTHARAVNMIPRNAGQRLQDLVNAVKNVPNKKKRHDLMKEYIKYLINGHPHNFAIQAVKSLR